MDKNLNVYNVDYLLQLINRDELESLLNDYINKKESKQSMGTEWSGETKAKESVTTDSRMPFDNSFNPKGNYPTNIVEASRSSSVSFPLVAQEMKSVYTVETNIEKETSQINRTLRQQRDRIEFILANLDRLREKLHPILLPENPTKSEGISTLKPIGSPHSVGLDLNNEDLTRISGQICYLIDQLDL